MTEKQAIMRFNKVFFSAAFVYLLGVLTAMWARNYMMDAQSIFDFWSHDNMLLARVIYYILTLIPTVAMFVMAWAQWRFINELDEFLRMIQIKGLLFGLLCLLVTATGWGMLEILLSAPALPVFWMVPIFWVTQSLSVGYIKTRERGFGHEE